MAAHHLTIARATFAASLLRPDFIKINRDDLPLFHNDLETAIAKCSPQNIQKCRQWVVDNIAFSAQRTSALGKYLASFSKYSGLQVNEKEWPSLSRRRLHILYLLNDILHHMKYHGPNVQAQNNFISFLQPFVLELFQLAALKRKKRVLLRLEALVDAWSKDNYLDENQIPKFRDALQSHVSKSSFGTTELVSQDSKNEKELPFMMPATHGDPSLAFYDLPAGNLMPHIIPNSGKPMQSDQIRALRFAAGIADDGLINAVKDFLKDVESIDNIYNRLDDEDVVADIDEMGQLSYRDEAGNIVGDTYYGWSRTFCEKMKGRDKVTGDELHGRRRSRSSSRSRSSRSPRKRRRYSDSARSSSSYSPEDRTHRRADASDGKIIHGSRSRSRSRSYSPEEDRPQFQFNTAMLTGQRFSNVSQWMQDAKVSPGTPLPSQTSQGIQGTSNFGHQSFIPPPLGPNGFPIPPPRPTNWIGPWPPPPPPVQGISLGLPPMPLPPPPPPNFASQQFDRGMQNGGQQHPGNFQ